MLIAVDTGGTKTLVASFARDGSLQRSVRFPTPKDPKAYITELVKTIHEVTTALPTLISVGVPGLVCDGVAVWCPHLGWENFAIASAIKKHFPVPVFVENDANLAGLAETRALPTQPEFSLYVTVSTGIGTGVIVNGQIDPSLRDGEGGHMVVEYDGTLRVWESFAAGSAIYKTYGKYAHDITSERTWHQIADRISRGFLAMIPLLQPDVIIIGGSIGTYFDRYSGQLTKLLDEKLPPHFARPTISQALHPEEAVIYGCYYHAIDQAAA